MDASTLLNRVIAGDPHALGQALTTADPALLVAAALVVPSWGDLLDRAARGAGAVGERQVVAIAHAYLSGDLDRVRLLARDHLADHPNSPLVAHIAGRAHFEELS